MTFTGLPREACDDRGSYEGSGVYGTGVLSDSVAIVSSISATAPPGPAF